MLLAAVGQTAVARAEAGVVVVVARVDDEVAVDAGADDGVVVLAVGFALLPHAVMTVAIATSPMNVRRCFLFVMARVCADPGRSVRDRRPRAGGPSALAPGKRRGPVGAHSITRRVEGMSIVASRR